MELCNNKIEKWIYSAFAQAISMKMHEILFTLSINQMLSKAFMCVRFHIFSCNIILYFLNNDTAKGNKIHHKHIQALGMQTQDK